MKKGIAVSPGIVISKALVLKEEVVDLNTNAISEQAIAGEISRLEDALKKSALQVAKIVEKALEELGAEKAQVFEAHKMLLDDPVLKDTITEKIKKEGISADYATHKAVEELKVVFEMMDSEYMRERAADIKDIGQRLINNIVGKETIDLAVLNEDVVIIGKDLTPSDTASMDKARVKGFATEIGGRTSHTAIIARTLEIPAVVGCGQLLDEIKTGDTVVIDGSTGEVCINPAQTELDEYSRKAAEFQARKEKMKALKALPPETTDGHRVELAGNIGKPEDVIPVLENGGEAVGLFRTEFLYMNRENFPNEEEQFMAYKSAAERMSGRPIIIRTLDIGGDKHLPYLELPEEANPFLGYRAIRICLEQTDLFKTQLKAILRGSAFGKLKVMFPMISGIAEIRKAKAVLEECKIELRSAGAAFDENLEVGIMIEIPSAAMMADQLAKEVDFFSIGTNDLCQYTLAVDRMNEKISDLYDPLHPAVLRLIKKVIDDGHKEGIMVGVCGEMASGVENALILLGMGLDEFSMSAVAIPYVKEVIRNISLVKAQEILNKCLQMETGAQIKEYIQNEMKSF
ncbi:MAG: phosphoenolpyruvate--protein phosphotransferase [Pelosinus sp.]|nr:phosphoenolpyruvate--protein phosphotransferase [Pelosinus sp.]